MEMNNLRVESHVAQKNRRHKLRFQQNYGDLNHQHPPPQQDQPLDIHRPYSYNPNVFPSEMLHSIARNPHLLLPPNHGLIVSHDHHQDSSSNAGATNFANISNPQDSNNWKPVVSSQQQVTNDHWVNSSYSNVASLNSGCYGYNQDMQNVSAFGSSQFYHNTLQQDHVTLAHPPLESDFMANRIHDHHRDQQTITQGLSLSLSSVPHLKEDQQILQSGQKHLKSDPKSLMGVSSFGHRNTGPLGPFTGYAIILKNSKYMKPAQEVLNQNCDVGLGCQELFQNCHDVYSQKILEEEISKASDCGSDQHRSSPNSESLQPEFHRKKARLLYLQEEVCRRYKQYLQQMQMVISSFETVAGLSAASPYVSLALKAVLQHFHYVKNVISDQPSQGRKMMGDQGLCSSTTTSTSWLKSIDQRFGKSGGGGGGVAGFFASQQPAWRPQRGLPERAIAVLKTWLFDHFLHPYPSDADKHMLANQTGLTRNQVSNWFINARVRIWKPMVEEIHTLETKGLVEQNSTNNPQPDGNQNPSGMDMSSMSNTQPPECSMNPSGVTLTLDESNERLQEDHEKQARPEYQIPLSSMDRLMSIMPYPRATFDEYGASGLGPVSLTLGLRQNAEHVQQLQQHFGGQLIHDFVG